MNLNKVFVIGRLTHEPEMRSTQGGQNVTTLRMATNRVWNDKSGMKKEDTEFHNVVVWGKQADVAGRFLKKGGLVLIEGRLQTRDWEDKSGQKRKTTEIIGERIQLGPRPMGSRAEAEDKPVAAEIPTIDISDEEIKTEDLPF